MDRSVMLKSLMRGVVVSAALALPLAAQTTAEPSSAEAAMFGAAQKSGTKLAYEAYLKKYPDGVFAEIARFELEWATQSTATAADAAPATAAPGLAASGAVVPPQTGIKFETALIAPGTAVDGKSIADLIEGSPLFVPIEGIPEEMWKGQSCSNCHTWTQEALCTQGQTYTGPNGAHSLVKDHPYGGAFKAALKTFAQEGCQ